MKRRVRTAIWLVVLCGAAVGAFFAWDRLARPWAARREVDGLIAQAQSGDAASLDRLMEMLTTASVSEEEGNRILSAVFQPQIVTRSAYRFGRPVNISVETPLPRGMFWEDGRGVWDCWVFAEDIPGELNDYLESCTLEDRYLMESSFSPPVPSGSQPIMDDPTRLLCPVAPRGSRPDIETIWPVGTHRANVLVACVMTAVPTRKTLHWPSTRPFPRNLLPEWQEGHAQDLRKHYRCKRVISITFRVARPGEAENVVLRSDPELDEAMKAAFTQYPAVLPPTDTEGRAVGAISLAWTELPENAAFRVEFHPESGRTILSEGWSQLHRGVLRAGSKDHAEARFVVSVPGKSTDLTRIPGKAVFVPDESAAYRDPTIKTIWGGRLEYPLTLTAWPRRVVFSRTATAPAKEGGQ